MCCTDSLFRGGFTYSHELEQTRTCSGGRSGLAVSEDGEVSVNREVTMTALVRDEEGNVYLKVAQARTRQVVGQVAGIFAITGSEEESTPRARHSVTMPDNDETSMKKKVLVCVFSIIFGSVPVAMTVFGINDYYGCPEKPMHGIYMIAQGATSVFIPILASWWCCCQCISGKFIISCCVIIGLFNVAWGIFGTIILLSDHCEGSWAHVIVFTILLWIFFGILLLACYCFMCYRCVKDD